VFSLGIWDPFAVKVQTVKTAIESACLLLRVDDIVSGLSKNKGQQQQQNVTEEQAEAQEGMMEQ
jgi:T-complex protein 1 subunit gamma